MGRYTRYPDRRGGIYMNRKELYDDKLQLDYFSDSYLRFESDFYKYSALDIPLTFITDDILRTMAMSQKHYFKLNKSKIFRRS